MVAEELHPSKKIINYPKYSFNPFNKSKTNRSLFMFSSKAKRVKNIEELQQEVGMMVDKAEFDAKIKSQETIDYKTELQIFYTDIVYKAQLQSANKLVQGAIKEEIKDRVKLETIKHVRNALLAGRKHFFCTQFVAWVIQMAVGELNQNGIIPYGITDVLNIRDTKATPARLADILKHSLHFKQFHSVERYVHKKDR